MTNENLAAEIERIGIELIVIGMDRTNRERINRQLVLALRSTEHGPDFNSDDNLHADTVAERYESQKEGA